MAEEAPSVGGISAGNDPFKLGPEPSAAELGARIQSPLGTIAGDAAAATTGTSTIGPATMRVAAGEAAAETATVGSVGGVVAAVDPAVGVVGAVATAASFAPMVAPTGVGLVEKAAGKMGKHEVVNKLQMWREHWHPEMKMPGEAIAAAGQSKKVGFLQRFKMRGGPLAARAPDAPVTRLDHIGNIGFAIGSGVTTYGVAKSFNQGLDELKHAIADVEGVPMSQISTRRALFGSIPNDLKPAREHLFKEHAIRGVAQVAGMVAMIWAVRAKKHLSGPLGMAAIMAPGFVDMGANQVLGESELPLYAELKNAYNAKQPIAAQPYANLVLAINSELKKRDYPAGEQNTVGKIVAAKLGEQYAAENIDPGKILQENSNGKLPARIKGVIAEAEAEHAANVAKAKAERAEAERAKAEAKAHPTHVDKLNGMAAQRPVVGDFTKRVSEKTPATLGVP